MNRCSFLFITLLAPCVFTLSASNVPQAQATLPVLSNTAKKAPPAEKQLPSIAPTIKNTPQPVAITATATKKPVKGSKGSAEPICTIDTSSDGPIILGSKGSIASVKEKVAQVTCATEAPAARETKRPRLAAINKHITSKSAIILDAETGDTIFAKSPDNPRQPASTIKVLTGMIAIKRLKKNEKVEVSRHAEKMPRSKVYLSTQKQYKANDLINAVLLASANDASVALAEKIAGSEKDFAKLMTLHARLWGAKNTICRTASGLTAKGQQSTARDLAQIFRHAMQDREFAKRMKRTKIKTSYGKLLRNHNRALWQVNGALAGKTGYTNMARQTYVGQFQRGDDTIVVAIMGSETMWTDIKRLVEYGFKRKEQVRIAQLEKTKSES
ncbi:MAG: serine hydrolase [Candidatus Electrothrix aestuarii]|uniref:Serine hydrolase n=1 Tax=Candidatus Electrothrix aestuarii TaxID=3062594 RepID=A0AAU8LVF3_9BACT|nr:serine hydrolase [Candidatus Electrothrix aestuarii]